ncbi:hypothetical protein L249_7583, partial [Ophiocordyceps polyrhachis-furcata BCC 54312]
ISIYKKSYRLVKRLFSAVEIIISNQGVDHVIEKKKTNHVIVVFLEEDFNVMD